MIYRRLLALLSLALLSLALLCCLCPLPVRAADHDPTGVELTPRYLALFNGGKGWAPLKEGGLRALDSQDPANPHAADTLSLTLERSRPREGVATLVFRTYARNDSAREAFAKDWRWRYDNHVVPSGSAAPFVRSVHEASANGRTLVWGLALTPPGAPTQASYEVAVLQDERCFYGRIDLNGVSLATAEQALADLRQAGEIFREHLGGPPAPDTAAEVWPILELAAEPQPVSAEGQAVLTATLSENSSKEIRPLSGKTLTFELLAGSGLAGGRLSAASAITDADGRARITYTAPTREQMPSGAVCRAMVRVTAGDPAISETLPIDLDNKSGLLLRVEHPILPGQPGFDNHLTLRFDTPRGERGRDYLVRLRTTSGQGRLARLDGGTGSETLELRLASGMDNTLVYRWSGPPPAEQAVAETVVVEIPELQLHGETSFSVGIDLMLESVRLAWQGPFYPGMALPVEAALVDRFHPDADLAALLTTLKIEPALELRQKSFAPIPIGSTLGDRFLANFVHHVAGAAIPRASVVWGISFATVRRSRDGRWLMLWQDQEPIDAMPRLTPYDIGNYLFEARLDPRLEGDPQPELHTASLQVEVSETPPEEEMLFTFLLPTIQSLSAFAPPAGMGKLAWTVSSHIHEGNYAEAARELGKEYLLSPLNDRITEKVTKKLAPWGEALIETLRQRLPPATMARIEGYVGRQAEALDQQWVEEAMEILDLDLIGNTVGAMTEAVEEQAAETFGYGAPPQASFWRRLLTVNEAWAAKPAPGLYDAARFYQQFLRGTDRYGVLIVSRRGMSGLTATAADGRPIQLRENAMLFDRPERCGLLLPHVAVIPFVRGEQFHIALQGDGETPVMIYKVLGTGISHGRLGGDGRAWEKSLLVDGAAVR